MRQFEAASNLDGLVGPAVRVAIGEGDDQLSFSSATNNTPSAETSE